MSPLQCWSLHACLPAAIVLRHNGFRMGSTNEACLGRQQPNMAYNSSVGPAKQSTVHHPPPCQCCQLVGHWLCACTVSNVPASLVLAIKPLQLHLHAAGRAVPTRMWGVTSTLCSQRRAGCPVFADCQIGPEQRRHLQVRCSGSLEGGATPHVHGYAVSMVLRALPVLHLCIWPKQPHGSIPAVPG